MSRPFIYFDLESTGPDPYHDRIVEMSFVAAGKGMILDARVNPERSIPAEASDVHGIYDEDVADLPVFAFHAAEVQRILRGAVLVGYNLRRFDTVLIDRELRMAGQPGLERDDHGRIVQPEVDLFGIWQRCEPRNLTAAARRFAGVDLEDAHTASADTDVLPGILAGMTHEFGLGHDLEELCELSKPEGCIDRDGKFVLDEHGVPRFNFGKHRGQPVHSEPGFLRWMASRDFSPETLEYARRFLLEVA